MKEQSEDILAGVNTAHPNNLIRIMFHVHLVFAM